jgi:hypothetical protein
MMMMMMMMMRMIPFMVGQSHDSFTLLSVKDVKYFSLVSRLFMCCARGTDSRHSEANQRVMHPVLFCFFAQTSEWQAKKS